MNIILVNPRLKTWSPNVYPPLGLCYIAASLEKAGHDVSILDMNSRRVSDKELVKRISRSVLIGIGGLVTEYTEVVRLVKVIQEYGGRIIVLGGPLATTHAKELLLSSHADVAVIGEGEQTIVELVGAIENSHDKKPINGIAYMDKGQVITHPPQKPITDLDTIPHPARHLLDMGQYSTHHFQTFGIKVPKMKSTTMISTRGCGYHCTFCDRHADGANNKWKARSPEDIVSEMRELRDNYDIHGFIFNDDTFVVNRKRVIDFCALLEEELPDVVWYCNGRVNLMNEEMIEAMADSGCKGIAYGIESGNQGILDSIKKAITLEQVSKVVGWMKKAGIHVTGYFMLGILGDTKQTMQETLDFAEKLDLNFYGFGITSPIPGTEMYAKAVEKGLVGKNKRLEDWSFHAQMNLTEDCSTEELERLNEYAFRKFTIEKRWGRHYLWNWRLWWEGLRTLVFLARKRNVSELLRKVLALLRH